MYSQNQSSLHPYSKENERVEVTSLKTKSSKRRMKEEEGKAALREGGGRGEDMRRCGKVRDGIKLHSIGTKRLMMRSNQIPCCTTYKRV